MSDIVKRLRVKADIIQPGERVAWGSGSQLMREAAALIERQREALRVAREALCAIADARPVEATLTLRPEWLQKIAHTSIAQIDAALKEDGE
jgi:hypothetical protein